jgi:hypothetical protein
MRTAISVFVEIMSSKVASSISMSSLSLSVRADAVRGRLSRSAISPKNSPAPRVTMPSSCPSTTR